MLPTDWEQHFNACIKQVNGEEEIDMPNGSSPLMNGIGGRQYTSFLGAATTPFGPGWSEDDWCRRLKAYAFKPCFRKWLWASEQFQ